MSNSERKAKIRRRENIAALNKFLAEPAGRRYIYDLLASCHVYHTSYSPNALDMAYAEGERAVGLKLLGDLETANPDAFLLMLKEAKDERYPSSNSSTDRDAESDPFAVARDDDRDDDSA